MWRSSRERLVEVDFGSKSSSCLWLFVCVVLFFRLEIMIALACDIVHNIFRLELWMFLFFVVTRANFASELRLLRPFFRLELCYNIFCVG